MFTVCPVVLFAGFLFVSCGATKEVLTLPHPNGMNVAHVRLSNGGATTDYGFHVDVDGERVAWLTGPEIGNEYGMTLAWERNALVIRRDSSRSEMIVKETFPLAGGTGRVRIERSDLRLLVEERRRQGAFVTVPKDF